MQGMRNQLITILAVAACGGGQKPSDPSKSWAEHMSSAEQHEENAINHEQAARHATRLAPTAAYTCGDTVLGDQLTIGTERVQTTIPCWDTEEEAAMAHRHRAEKERTAAKNERSEAAALVQAEAAACAGIPAAELTHSPFAHKKAIAQVIAHREGGAIHGARVVFKPVPGLTAGYMRKAIACQQARFAVAGKPASFMPEDPTLLDNTKATVFERGGHLEVLITTESDVEGAVSLARAQDLLPQKAASN